MGSVLFVDGKITSVDLFGNIVERSKYEFPYSYSPYLIFGLVCADKKYFRFIYSDRVEQLRKLSFFDQRKVDVAKAVFDEMFGTDVKICAIAEGCNQSTGYPHLIYALDITTIPD